MTGKSRRSPSLKARHGTCIAIGDVGVLILGPPGSGKSDLALRLIDQPGLGLDRRVKKARLVADDQVLLRPVNGKLVASAPGAVAGKLEIRGLGIVTVPHRKQVTLGLAVELAPKGGIERMPERGANRLSALGISLPLVVIDAASASAPARVRAAVARRTSI